MKQELIWSASFKDWWRERRQVWTKSLYKKTPRKNLPVFTRAGDKISEQVLFAGEYEPQLLRVAEHLRRGGYGGFLIDIGANIGLSSFQLQSFFGSIYCFEPNPYAYRILEVNLREIPPGRLRLFNLGLGAADSVSQLCMPRNNWGGAYLKDAGNAYDEQTLVAKEAVGAFDDPDFLEVIEVKVAGGRQVLTGIFAELASKGERSGLIKIDVEGYEKTVLREVAASIPPDFRLAIYFENWDQTTGKAEFLDLFGGAARLYSVQPVKAGKGLAEMWGYFTGGNGLALTENFDRAAGDLLMLIG